MGQHTIKLYSQMYPRINQRMAEYNDITIHKEPNKLN